VISGFITVYPTSESFGGFAGLREFMLRWIVRIVPMYWMATFAFLAYILAKLGHRRAFPTRVMSFSTAT
jgi:peptidoglycan/LPS O-acetylase OafA/YrhL